MVGLSIVRVIGLASHFERHLRDKTPYGDPYKDKPAKFLLIEDANSEATVPENVLLNSITQAMIQKYMDNEQDQSILKEIADYAQSFIETISENDQYNDNIDKLITSLNRRKGDITHRLHNRGELRDKLNSDLKTITDLLDGHKKHKKSEPPKPDNPPSNNNTIPIPPPDNGGGGGGDKYEGTSVITAELEQIVKNTAKMVASKIGNVEQMLDELVDDPVSREEEIATIRNGIEEISNRIGSDLPGFDELSEAEIQALSASDKLLYVRVDKDSFGARHNLAKLIFIFVANLKTELQFLEEDDIDADVKETIRNEILSFKGRNAAIMEMDELEIRTIDSRISNPFLQDKATMVSRRKIRSRMGANNISIHFYQ